MKVNTETINADWYLPEGQRIFVEGEPVTVESYHHLYENDWYRPKHHRCHKCLGVYPEDTLALHSDTHAIVPCVPCNAFTEFSRSW